MDTFNCILNNCRCTWLSDSFARAFILRTTLLFFHFVSGQNLSDGQWHSVAIEVKGQKVSLTVNNQKPVSMEISGLIQNMQRTAIFIGGIASEIELASLSWFLERVCWLYLNAERVTYFDLLSTKLSSELAWWLQTKSVYYRKHFPECKGQFSSTLLTLTSINWRFLVFLNKLQAWQAERILMIQSFHMHSYYSQISCFFLEGFFFFLVHSGSSNHIQLL